MFDALYMMGGLGLAIGACLAVASKIFYVYVDPKILAVDDALPGANCGGCGLPGCSANAEAIVAGRAAPNSCVVAGEEVAQEIAAILGVSVEAKEPDIARPGCTYGVAEADTKYVYDGMNDCRAAVLLSGGMKVCTIGCLGLGTCARACPFDAITMGPQGLPVVDEVKCTGCGTCERVCPKNIINLSSVTRRILKEYTTDECTTPCQRACPAGINICEYIRQISMGEHHRAVQVIKERNPFPAVIGRICPRPCELECRRQYVDEPVAINFLKRYAADYEKEKGERILPYKAPPTGRNVAVVGGGVEGLSSAFFLARLGHEPVVYEAAPKPGGLLRSAIAKYRLPEEILDWDIDGISEMGVRVETRKALGKDVTIESLLRQGFEAVLLAAGGWDSRLARGTAHEVESPVPGTYLLLDFIRNARADDAHIELQQDVVIYGGGKLAAECARLCRAQGIEKVTILFREPKENSQIGDADIESLAAENVDVVFNTGIRCLYGENNVLTAVEKIALDTRETAKMPAKMLILATGRFPELIFARPKTEQIESDEKTGNDTAESVLQWEGIDPYKAPALYTEAGLFARGDAFSDYSAAIKAIGAGRRAAASVHEIMYDITLDLPDNVAHPQARIQNVDHVENVAATKRQIMPLCNQEQQLEYTEIELGFDGTTARSEADRCLQCGLICYQQTQQMQRAI
jgi:NADPH-dependent glutamate synthase beta subunit-like oxidoreductase